MVFRFFTLSTLLALGCASPMTRVSDYGGMEGWPPSVSSVNPQTGPAGTMVTLKGAYLDDAKQVLIGGKPAAFTLVGTDIQATVPLDLRPGTCKVVVVVPRGKTAPMTFNVVP
jgi:hypothetical protein